MYFKELKYATYKHSTVTFVFDCFWAYDEMRKRHVIDKIDIKTSKTMKKANCGVNVREKVKMPNIVHAW